MDMHSINKYSLTPPQGVITRHSVSAIATAAPSARTGQHARIEAQRPTGALWRRGSARINVGRQEPNAILLGTVIVCSDMAHVPKLDAPDAYQEGTHGHGNDGHRKTHSDGCEVKAISMYACRMGFVRSFKAVRFSFCRVRVPSQTHYLTASRRRLRDGDRILLIGIKQHAHGLCARLIGRHVCWRLDGKTKENAQQPPEPQ